MASKTGNTADFERDPNQGSLQMDDLSHPEHSAKEKRFLLSELKTIKDQLHQKLLKFKARTQGRIGVS